MEINNIMSYVNGLLAKENESHVNSTDLALLYKMIEKYGVECEKSGLKEALEVWSVKNGR